MRIHTMSRWPMCSTPSAPLSRWWIWRSRIGSKSACILRPGHLDPDGQRVACSPPPCRRGRGRSPSNLPSSTSSSSFIWQNSKPSDFGPASSTCMCVPARSARPRRPGEWETGMSIFGDLDLEAADLDGLGHDLVVGDVGDHVLVGAHAGGQDLRDVGVGDGREAVVDGPGRRGVPLVGRPRPGPARRRTRGSCCSAGCRRSRRAGRRRRPWRPGWRSPRRGSPRRCPGRRARAGSASRPARPSSTSCSAKVVPLCSAAMNT